jgi:hypothetical protein
MDKKSQFTLLHLEVKPGYLDKRRGWAGRLELVDAEQHDALVPLVRRVTELTNRRWVALLVAITVDGDTDGPLIATGIHPFWVDGRGWTDAQDLYPGDQLRQADGDLVAVQAVRIWDQADTRVYNFTVADLHTYYVLADEPILVHNASSDDCRETASVIVQHPSASAARRAAEREAGMGKHGPRFLIDDSPYHPGSRSPTGPPGQRKTYQDPRTGGQVHQCRWGTAIRTARCHHIMVQSGLGSR